MSNLYDKVFNVSKIQYIKKGEISSLEFHDKQLLYYN